MFKNIETMSNYAEKPFNRIFKLITCNLWNGNVEDGIEKIRNKTCQQISNQDETTCIGKATNEGLQREKFLLEGTVHKMSRESAREQCKKEFLRLKRSLKKSGEQSTNKQSTKNNNKKRKKHHQHK